MSIGDNVRRRWPKDWPLQAIPPARWADQRPTYREASPAII
ncbi:MAG TPA: 2Fe-2S ferredoxin, partial [Mycobacterium sp.]